MEYMIEGDDAAHAPTLFAAMRTTIDRWQRKHEQTGGDDRARLSSQQRVYTEPRSPEIDNLIRQASLRDQIGVWVADPGVDQPLLQEKDIRDADPRMLAEKEQMALVLKLIQRFSAEPRKGIQPRVVGLGIEGMKDFSPPSKKAAPETLAALYRRLTDPAAEPWATTDVDGRLLTARDAERLERTAFLWVTAIAGGQGGGYCSGHGHSLCGGRGHPGPSPECKRTVVRFHSAPCREPHHTKSDPQPSCRRCDRAASSSASTRVSIGASGLHSMVTTNRHGTSSR